MMNWSGIMRKKVVAYFRVLLGATEEKQSQNIQYTSRD
jgi:hypothetical protein